jgi:hypothetical protein
MWIEKLDGDVRRRLNMISGNLGLPELREYASEAHFLADVYSRINEAGALARQAAKALGKS